MSAPGAREEQDLEHMAGDRASITSSEDRDHRNQQAQEVQPRISFALGRPGPLGPSENMILFSSEYIVVVQRVRAMDAQGLDKVAIVDKLAREAARFHERGVQRRDRRLMARGAAYASAASKIRELSDAVGATGGDASSSNSRWVRPAPPAPGEAPRR